MSQAKIPPTRRTLVVPALSTLVMLVVLVGLGTWQVYRLQWKEGVLARIAAADAAPPEPLRANPEPFTKVVITGHFRFDRAAEFGSEVRDTRTGATIGAYQIVPLERDNAPSVLVNRGWIPERRPTPLVDPSGEVTVTGYVRPSDKAGWFSAPDDAAGRHFYTLDATAIAPALGIADVTPFVLVALGSDLPENYPAPAQHLPRPPNNHLSYVITWYGLAIALIVIFGVWIRKGARS